MEEEEGEEDITVISAVEVREAAAEAVMVAAMTTADPRAEPTAWGEVVVAPEGGSTEPGAEAAW